ncbi:helix-turn-helix domain-containing protein [Sporocytophaga myxococcoides]|uniref:helix-turn-helix domain-containing protein n=1 Tax=Sporocytophaga myxococcoides TaxID=153721 RepID=UPI000429F74F|nr:helix-turn-helix transcriptional regulator [Sporocytophaga myxococcoides]
MLQQIFGKVVRELRIEKGITQEKLAELADLDRAFIYHLEAGNKEPSLTTIFKISDGLKVSPSVIIGKIDEIRRG